MTQKIVATITAVVGALGVFVAILSAFFGVELTPEQLEALAGLGGLIVTLTGLWLHPGVSQIGPSEGDVSGPDA